MDPACGAPRGAAYFAVPGGPWDDRPRMARRVPLWVPLLAGVALFLLAKKASAWTGAGKPRIPDTPENRDWLTRLLLTETGDVGDKEEWAAIAYVAINRAEAWQATADRKLRQGKPLSAWAVQHYPNMAIKAISDTSGWFGSTPPEKFTSGTILTHPRAGKVRSFVDDIFDGAIANPIGPRKMFVHPGGMPECGVPAGTKNRDGSRVCRETEFGYRWIPIWAIPSEEGGRAEYDPQKEGRAIFAGLGLRRRR